MKESRPKGSLGHPNRRRILEHVRQNPGARLDELCRATGLCRGTMRHHVEILLRAGRLVVRRAGRSRRLFPAEGGRRPGWLQEVLLREPALAELHAWVHRNQPAPRTAILDAMEERGWSRSTTQYRLKRLAKNGLVHLDPHGNPSGYVVMEGGKCSGQTVPGVSQIP